MAMEGHGITRKNSKIIHAGYAVHAGDNGTHRRDVEDAGKFIVL
jgi:hypothetical protein